MRNLKVYINFLAVIVLLLIPVQVFAHTHLESSDPATDEVVSSDNPIITLTFDSPVQEPNTISVSQNNEEITITEINHSPENVIEATLPTDLEDGEIVLFYSIIGEDGHVIEDSLVFTYEKADDNSSSTDETQSSEEESIEAEEDEVEENNIVEETEQASIEETEITNEQNGWLLPAIAVILIGIAISVFLINRKKK